jgi:hypothetical protein
VRYLLWYIATWNRRHCRLNNDLELRCNSDIRCGCNFFGISVIQVHSSFELQRSNLLITATLQREERVWNLSVLHKVILLMSTP